MLAEARHTDDAADAEHGVELDAGPHTREPQRLCILTRAVRPVAELIRFVIGPEGDVVPDVKGKLPGRGVWVTASREAVEAAVKRHVFARGFKRDARLSADLAEATEKLLERAAIDALAIAGKAGLVAVGFAKTAAALEHGEVIAVLHAAEGAPDGIRKLEAVSRRRMAEKPPLTVELLRADQLDLALGRPNVIHAALLAGPASDTCLSRLRRLGRFRTGGAGDRGNKAGNKAGKKTGMAAAQ
jgi:predicted RNA-binding protein YlxR (DUF448 family)